MSQLIWLSSVQIIFWLYWIESEIIWATVKKENTCTFFVCCAYVRPCFHVIYCIRDSSHKNKTFCMPSSCSKTLLISFYSLTQMTIIKIILVSNNAVASRFPIVLWILKSLNVGVYIQFLTYNPSLIHSDLLKLVNTQSALYFLKVLEKESASFSG